MNRAVVAFLDGRRLKGFLTNFSALRENFKLFPQDAAKGPVGADVHMRDLKAIFFVKDFTGDPAAKETPGDAASHGRKIVVTFKDGEELVGTTEGYNPQKLGFFMFPLAANSNNLRIFVINKNVRHVKMN
jgi:hypothetical protein